MASTATFNQVFLGFHYSAIDSDIHLHDDIEGSEGNFRTSSPKLALEKK
jgi:hypothetical protein